MSTQHAQPALEAVRRAAAELETALELLERGDAEARRLAGRWRDERGILRDVQRLSEGIERVTGEAHARARLERLLGIAGVRVSV